jgi:hypothetical protein
MNDALWWLDPDGTMHERCKLFFVSTSEQVEFDPGAHPELFWRRTGAAYFCQQCGDIWERIVLIDSKGQPKCFAVETVACEKHHDAWNIPGSRLVPRLEGILPLLPEGVLQREFEAHLAYYNNEGKQVGTTEELELDGSEGAPRRANGDG